MAWVTAFRMGDSGEVIHDKMLACVEHRFGDVKASHSVQRLTDNVSPYTAKDTAEFATAFNWIPCFTSVRGPDWVSGIGAI